MQTIILKSLQFQPKSKKKAWEWKKSGLYKFFTSSSIQKNFIDEVDFVWPALIFWTWWSASVHFCDENFSTSTDCFIVKTDNKEIDLKYIYYYLSWNIDILEQGFKWAWLKHISKEYLWEIQISLPPLSHQKQIIQKLDTFTNLINLRKLSIEKTEKLTKSIFIEIFWDPMINEKGWEVKKLKDIIIKLQAWKSLSWDDENIYKVLNTWSVSYDYFNWNDYKNLPKNYFPEEKNKVNIWDLLISRMNTEELVWAAAYVFHIWDNIYLPDRLWRVKSDKNIINNLYLWQYIIQPVFKKDIKQICSWTSWSMKNISMENFLSLKIPLPPISLQNKFASIVEKNEENIKKQKESLNKLEELYASVMQESFASP